MDIGKIISDRIKAALDDAQGRNPKGNTNIAISVNRDGSSSHTTVYTDDEMTIIERNGERQVIRHDDRAERDEG